MALKNKWSLESPCRLCAELCDRQLDHIFSDDNIYLVTLIKKYLSIKVGTCQEYYYILPKPYLGTQITINDTLPIQVCELCRSTVTTFNKYALRCTYTQSNLSSSAEILTDKPIDLFSEPIKEECNPFIKIEVLDSGSIKSENDLDNFSDDPLPVTRKYKKKRTLKVNKIKEEDKTTRKKSLRLKKKSTRSYSDSSNNEASIEQDVTSVNKPRKKVRSSAINSSFIKFICHVCNEEFLHWEILQKHTNKIHEVKPKVLCVCDQYLSSKNTIYKHIKMHDGNSFAHKCTECDNTFYTKPNLKKHFLLEHSNVTRPEHKCEQCGKIYPKLYLLKQHEIQHLPKEVRNIHPCEICGTKFASKMAVQIHNKHVHIKDKSFVCDICGKFFTSNGNLKSHRVVHSGDRPFLCPHCPKTFRSSFTLKCHSNIHNDVIYKCSKCPSTFSYANTLREHMNVHTDICRFTCGFCNKGFKWKRSFEAHLNIHTGKTPFSCPWCSKTFADGSNCRIHKRRAHPVELAEYEARKGISNQKIKRGPSTETTTIRSIQFDEVVKPQVFPKMDSLNLVKSDTD